MSYGNRPLNIKDMFAILNNNANAANNTSTSATEVVGQLVSVVEAVVLADSPVVTATLNAPKYNDGVSKYGGCLWG